VWTAREIAILTSHDRTRCFDPDAVGGIALESACRATFEFDYIAVQLKKGRGVLMSSTELQPYVLVLSKRHTDDFQDEVVYSASGRDFTGERVCWLKPFAMDKPGEWKVSLSLQLRDAGTDVPSIEPLEFTINVNDAARAARCEVEILVEGCAA
jgi:hypothetical protein